MNKAYKRKVNENNSTKTFYRTYSLRRLQAVRVHTISNGNCTESMPCVVWSLCNKLEGVVNFPINITLGQAIQVCLTSLIQ